MKLIKLLSLKLICWKLMKKQLLKVTKLYRLLYGGGTNLHPAIQTSVNFWNFAELYLCSLKMLSLSNFEIILLILRCSFQWCQQVFSNWPIQKVEKTMKSSIARKKSQLKSSHKQILMLWNVTASLLKRFWVILVVTYNCTPIF